MKQSRNIYQNQEKQKSKSTKRTMNVDAPPIIDEKQLKPVKEKYKQKKNVIRLY